LAIEDRGIGRLSGDSATGVIGDSCAVIGDWEWNPDWRLAIEGVMDFSKLDGLIPAVVQDRTSGEVLMVGFMNDVAWKTTLDTGYVTFFSRTRNTLWTKGETSGNRLAVRQIFTDCDDDTVLVKVDREGDGNVCHTGQRSCFFTEVKASLSAEALAKSEAGKRGSGVGGTDASAGGQR
jgi:phosphoribosyl-AMP cyclohydrolase